MVPENINRKDINRFDDTEESIDGINLEIVKIRLHRLMFECERQRRPVTGNVTEELS